MHLCSLFFVIVAMCGIFVAHAEETKKSRQIFKQILKVVLNDSSNSYEDLFTKLNMTTLGAGRVQSKAFYKCVHGLAPPYLRAYVYQIII